MTIDTATATIAEITYKPGWSFTVARINTDPHLVIGYPSTSPGRYTSEWLPMPLLSVRSMTTRRPVQWVFDWVRDIEARSADAAFRYAGQTVDEIEGP